MGGGPANTALVAVGLLLPLNFVLISFARERGFIFASVGPTSVFLFVESVIVAVLCRTDSVATVRHSHQLRAQLRVRRWSRSIWLFLR